MPPAAPVLTSFCRSIIACAQLLHPIR